MVSKKSGGNLLGQVAAGAVREGAYAAGQATGTAAGRIAGTAVYGAANQAAWNYATTIRNKDELTLGYRLESADGTVLLDKKEKRNAKADGEDLLTPTRPGRGRAGRGGCQANETGESNAACASRSRPAAPGLRSMLGTPPATRRPEMSRQHSPEPRASPPCHG